MLNVGSETVRGADVFYFYYLLYSCGRNLRAEKWKGKKKPTDHCSLFMTLMPHSPLGKFPQRGGHGRSLPISLF